MEKNPVLKCNELKAFGRIVDQLSGKRVNLVNVCGPETEETTQEDAFQ